jgi:sulfide:quinone oxidoreductase
MIASVIEAAFDGALGRLSALSAVAHPAPAGRHAGRRATVGHGPRHPARVVIVGGGVAALEAMLALHESVGPEARITLVAPEPVFTYRPLMVAEPFSAVAPRLDLDALTGRRGVGRHSGPVTAVDPTRRLIRTGDGGELRYDMLVVASGASRRRARPGSLTLGDSLDVPAIRRLIGDLESGRSRAAAFIVPARRAWALPVYEAALLVAARAERAGAEVELTVVTPERVPLEILGGRASRAIGELLRRRGVAFRGSTFPLAVEAGGLLTVPGRPVPADAVVSAPELTAATLPGLPTEARGFVPADEFGRVDGRDDLYVVGEASAEHAGHGGPAGRDRRVGDRGIDRPGTGAAAVSTRSPRRPSRWRRAALRSHRAGRPTQNRALHAAAVVAAGEDCRETPRPRARCPRHRTAHLRAGTTASLINSR